MSEFKEKDKHKKKYGYGDRLFILFLLALLVLSLTLIMIDKAIKFAEHDVVTYNEKGNLDYKVNLKKNDFYDNRTLNKDMIYVASLIDNIDVNFNYDFNISEKNDIKFAYDIIGDLVITDTDGKNTFFEKKYTLKKKQMSYLKDKKNYSFKDSIKVDYNTYNDLANRFRSNYGIDTKSDLIVYLNVYKQGSEESVQGLNNNSHMTLTIPLSEKAIDIKMDSKGITNTNKVYNTTGYKIKNYYAALIALVLFIIFIIIIIMIIRTICLIRSKKSKYERYIKKLLREYDRLIVETVTAPNESGKNIIEIDSFDELLDVRDNLGLPIKHYIVDEKLESNFYIDHSEELYLLDLKSSDFEEEQKK